jgi:lipoprotein LprG
MDSASVFAIVAVGAAVLAMVAMVAAAFGAFRSDGADASSPEDEQVDDDGAVADPNAQATEVVNAAASAMSGVTSVEFRLQRDGAPIYIDEFERIALNSLRGQFAVPGKAQAEL